jgi:hypothetical protein
MVEFLERERPAGRGAGLLDDPVHLRQRGHRRGAGSVSAVLPGGAGHHARADLLPAVVC